MTSQTLRRRLHHGDVDGKKCEHLESSGMDSLSEPLLGKNDYDDKHQEVGFLEFSVWFYFFDDAHIYIYLHRCKL